MKSFIGTRITDYISTSFMCLVFFSSTPVFSATGTHHQSSKGSCQQLVGELNQMKKAQSQIIHSLAQNHDLFADQLSDLSFELSLYRKAIPQKTLNSMEKSAKAYHSRSIKAQETAERLNSLTADLIDRVQECLH